MPVVRTFVCHHGGDYAQQVIPFLRRAAPFGVRPWIDKHDLDDRRGLGLTQQLQEGLFNGSCNSMSLFLTQAAVERPWVEQEVRWALERMSEGFRIIPIWLERRHKLTLPPVFQGLLDRDRVLWIEPHKDPKFLEKYARSVLAAGGIDASTRELTIYLGHRSQQWEPVIPSDWASVPAIDLRLEVKGSQDLSPTVEQWKEIEAGLMNLRASTGQLERINICGQAPLGVGTLIGKVFNRSAGVGVPIQLRALNAQSGEVWTSSPLDFDLAGDWTPESSRLVKMARPAILRHKSLLLVLMLEDRKECLADVHRWNAHRAEPSLVHIASFPRIDSPEGAQQLVRELVGVIRYLRTACLGKETIELISIHPLALAPLLSYHLQNLKNLHFYDEVKKQPLYRSVTTTS